MTPKQPPPASPCRRGFGEVSSGGHELTGRFVPLSTQPALPRERCSAQLRDLPLHVRSYLGEGQAGLQRTVAASTVNGLPSYCGKIQHSNSVPTGTSRGLVTRQPPGERSCSSPSPATVRPFNENRLAKRTGTRTC